jgi:hypothetical protein
MRSVPDTKKVSFTYLQELIILCKPSHAHVVSTRLATMYFFTQQSFLRTPAAIPHFKHSLPMILASFSKPSVLHSPLHFSAIQSPPFHLHIHQSQHLLGGTTVFYSPSLSNLSSSLSYNHAYRVSSTRKALPTNPCSSFPFVYLKKQFTVSF